MNKKIVLSLVVDMNEETEKYYKDKENQADLHEAIISSDNAKLSIEDTEETSQEHWGE